MSAAPVLGIGIVTDDLATVLSPSQVNTWLDCQARWYYKYVERLPEKGSPSLALGAAVDQAMKATWSNKIENGVDLPISDIIDVYAQAWLKASAGVEFTGKDNSDEMAKQGAQMIEKYMREAEPAIHPQAVDYEVRGTIAGVAVRGFVDLVTIEGTTVDLKTAARTPKAISPNHAFQLTTYAQLVKDLDLNGKGRIDTLVRLKKAPGLVQIEREVTLPDYHYLRSTYPLVQEQMRTGLYSPNRNSYLCNKGKCAYWRLCEAEYGGCVRGDDDEE